MRAAGAGPGEAGGDPAGERLALAGEQRGVGRHHGDDRARAGRGLVGAGRGVLGADWAGWGLARPGWGLVGLGRGLVGGVAHRVVGGELLAQVDAGEHELVPLAEVSLHEHADGVAGVRVVDQPRRGAGAALELVTVHPGAAADGALVWLAVRRVLERGDHYVLGDMMAVDVVEVAVPGFGGDRQQPDFGELGMVPVHPGDDAGVRDPDRVGVGDHDRALEGPRLFDPGDPGHLPVAVLRVEAGRHRIAGVSLAAGVDRRDTGPYAVALDQRAVADFEAGNVGDGVPGAWPAAEAETESAGAWLAD